MVYLPVLFQLVVFLLPLVQCRVTVHPAQMTPKPPKRTHRIQHPHHIRHPAFSVVTMTPLLNRTFRSAPHHLVLLLPKAIHSFPLHLLHLALNAVLNPKFLLINRGYSSVWFSATCFRERGWEADWWKESWHLSIGSRPPLWGSVVDLQQRRKR